MNGTEGEASEASALFASGAACHGTARAKYTSVYEAKRSLGYDNVKNCFCGNVSDDKQESAACQQNNFADEVSLRRLRGAEYFVRSSVAEI